MDYDEFIGKVEEKSGIQSRDKARRAIKATLETLAYHITKGERKDLSAQLPDRIKNYLLEQGGEEAHSFSTRDFMRRVALEARLNDEEAQSLARAVLSTLKGTISGGEFDNLLSQLPKAFHDLFDNLGELSAA